MRTVSGGADESQNGQIQFIVEENGGTFAKALTGNASCGDEWQVFYFPFEFKDNYVRATVRYGYYQQIIEFGGYTIINYENKVNVADLPSYSINTSSIDKGAPWREEAWDRIEQIRRGDFNIVVKNASGAPVSNADIKVDMYEHEFEFGTAISPNILKDTNYQAVIQTNFNTVVAENATKWHYYEKNPQNAIDIFDKAKELGIKKFRGHTLVWDRPVPSDGAFMSAYPEDLPSLHNDKDALMKRIEDHIKRIVSDISEYTTEWDVLNEACTNRVIQNIYGRAETIKLWYDMARNAGAEPLYYNDFKTNNEMILQVKLMVDNNVDFDGIGLQSHYTPVNDPESVIAFYNKLDEFGKRLKVTEYDFKTDDLNLQANFTRDMLIAAFAQESMDGFLLWGFKGGAENKYILYDDNWNAKPSLEAWQDLIYNKWWTNESGKTDSNGSFAVKAYYGDYDITVTANGITKTVSVPLYKDSDNTITIVMD